MFSSGLRCDKCGRGDTDSGMENVPPHMRPFIRGEVVIVNRPIGICGMCYAVLCSDCANNGRCTECDSPFPLLANCPSVGSPWWKIRKWLKWRAVLSQEYKSMF